MRPAPLARLGAQAQNRSARDRAANGAAGVLRQHQPLQRQRRSPDAWSARNNGAPSGSSRGSMARNAPPSAAHPARRAAPAPDRVIFSSRKNTTLGLLLNTSAWRSGCSASHCRSPGAVACSSVSSPARPDSGRWRDRAGRSHRQRPGARVLPSVELHAARSLDLQEERIDGAVHPQQFLAGQQPCRRPAARDPDTAPRACPAAGRARAHPSAPDTGRQLHGQQVIGHCIQRRLERAAPRARAVEHRLVVARDQTRLAACPCVPARRVVMRQARSARFEQARAARLVIACPIARTASQNSRHVGARRGDAQLASSAGQASAIVSGASPAAATSPPARSRGTGCGDSRCGRRCGAWCVHGRPAAARQHGQRCQRRPQRNPRQALRACAAGPASSRRWPGNPASCGCVAPGLGNAGVNPFAAPPHAAAGAARRRQPDADTDSP